MHSGFFPECKQSEHILHNMLLDFSKNEYHCICSTGKVTTTKPEKEETKDKTTNETIETPAKKEDTKKTEPTKKVNEPEVNSKGNIKDNPKATPLDKTKVGWEILSFHVRRCVPEFYSV
jgi:hypothetical protein